MSNRMLNVARERKVGVLSGVDVVPIGKGGYSEEISSEGGMILRTSMASMPAARMPSSPRSVSSYPRQ